MADVIHLNTDSLTINGAAGAAGAKLALDSTLTPHWSSTSIQAPGLSDGFPSAAAESFYKYDYVTSKSFVMEGPDRVPYLSGNPPGGSAPVDGYWASPAVSHAANPTFSGCSPFACCHGGSVAYTRNLHLVINMVLKIGYQYENNGGVIIAPTGMGIWYGSTIGYGFTGAIAQIWKGIYVDPNTGLSDYYVWVEMFPTGNDRSLKTANNLTGISATKVARLVPASPADFAHSDYLEIEISLEPIAGAPSLKKNLTGNMYFPVYYNLYGSAKYLIRARKYGTTAWSYSSSTSASLGTATFYLAAVNYDTATGLLSLGDVGYPMYLDVSNLQDPFSDQTSIQYTNAGADITCYVIPKTLHPSGQYVFDSLSLATSAANDVVFANGWRLREYPYYPENPRLGQEGLEVVDHAGKRVALFTNKMVKAKSFRKLSELLTQ